MQETPVAASQTRHRTPALLARHLAGILASALLLGLFARGGHAWPIGFFAMVPWLLALHKTRTLKGAVLSALLMAVGLELAMFAWFGFAFGDYAGLAEWPSLLVLAAAAPLLQPQVPALAIARHGIGCRQGRACGALAGASAWVGSEWLLPKLLGDTLGHGLYPSATLRQLADLGGAAGLSFLLLLINEALAAALLRRRKRLSALLGPLAIAGGLIALMAGYGAWRLSVLQAMQAEPAEAIRIGLVQSNITDYDRLRRERGAYATLRYVLDTHYAMSRHAVRERGADALLWSETVYPTPFGASKSEDGAVLDREILDFARNLGVPLVFGTYDRDAAGEYNAAAFVSPERGLLGRYRKRHPFPLTEYVPAWLDRPWLRRRLPWTGRWRPGEGAPIFPLRLRDGREIDAVPLICLDDVHGDVAIEGARLGAQAILGLSNDAWFSRHPQGARLHLAAAAFRSIETRLPQVRVTANGLSALIDESGEIVAHTEMGQRAVLVGEIPVHDPAETLMLRWGDWVGCAGWVLLAALAARPALIRRLGGAPSAARMPAEFSAETALLTRPWRMAAAGLRLAAGVGLACLLIGMLRDGLQVHSLAQIELFGCAVVAPGAAAWAIRRRFAARACIEAGTLVFEQPSRRIEISVQDIAGLPLWRLPLPSVGADLQFVSGRRWEMGMALSDPSALRQALAAAGSPLHNQGRLSAKLAEYAAHRAAAARRRLDHALNKFALFPLLLALPAFRLHQHIAFGGTFGELHTFGLWAWLKGLLIWWTAWSIGLMLFAAGLRILIEACSLAVLFIRPAQASSVRRITETLGRMIFYIGVPVLMGLRFLSD